MVLLKKMGNNSQKESEDHEKKIQEFISRAEKKESKKEEIKEEEEKKWVKFLIRIPSEFNDYINENAKSKLNGTRNSWILETIEDRIQKEKKKKEKDL